MSNGGKNTPDTLEGLICEVREQASGDGLTVQEAVDAFGGRALGPLLFLPAIFALSPVGGIPGIPTLIGIIVILIAGQSLLAQSHVWLPDILAQRELPKNKVQSSAETLLPHARRIDRWFGHRLTFLTRSPAPRIVAACSILLALLMPPLEIVPFAVALPAGAIVVLAAALILKDGLVMALGLALTVTAFWVAAGWLL